MRHLLLTKAILFLLVITSCKQQPQVNAVEVASDYPHDYAVLEWPPTDRVSKIRGAAEQISALFEAHARERHIPGVAWGIVVGDSLVLADALGWLDTDKQDAASTRAAYRIASMSKSFTAMAILHLRDQGQLLLSDPVKKHLPEMHAVALPTRDAPAITIADLLTMSAGFPEDNPWGDRQLDIANDTLAAWIRGGFSFSRTPGYQYEYSNLGYGVLGLIITRVSGLPYQDYIRDHILAPLGMAHTYWEFDQVPDSLLALGYRWEDEQWKPEPILHDGAFGAMGGLITTIEDFSKYVMLHLAAWPPRDGADAGPVRRSTIREMHEPQHPYLSAQATDYTGDPCAMMGGYGFGLGISRDCHDIRRVRHGGALPGYGSHYIFYPDYGIGIMAFGNLTYTRPLPVDELEKLLFETLDLPPWQQPVSKILQERQHQVAAWLLNRERKEDHGLFADNFFLDHDLAHRSEQIDAILDQAGAIGEVGTMEPFNQLRGTFTIEAEAGIIKVFFTLTPQSTPLVQRVDLYLDTDDG